jgi:aspartate/methionine/tyrosine aminotransferase
VAGLSPGYGVEHICFATLPEMKESTIFLGGFSKAYAMTGWRIGMVVGNAALYQRVHLHGGAVGLEVETLHKVIVKRGDPGFFFAVQEL